MKILPEIIRKRLMLLSFIFIDRFSFLPCSVMAFFGVFCTLHAVFSFTICASFRFNSRPGLQFTFLHPSQSLVRSEDSTFKKYKGLAIIQHKQIFELFAVLPLSESLLSKCHWSDCHKTNHMFLWGR